MHNGHISASYQRMDSFYIMTRDQVSDTKDTGGYLLTIKAPATSVSTENEVLGQALNIKVSLHLKKTPNSLRVYAQADVITWKHPAKYQTIALRMGVFHTTCNLLGIHNHTQSFGIEHHDLAQLAPQRIKQVFSLLQT